MRVVSVVVCIVIVVMRTGTFVMKTAPVAVYCRTKSPASMAGAGGGCGIDGIDGAKALW